MEGEKNVSQDCRIVYLTHFHTQPLLSRSAERYGCTSLITIKMVLIINLYSELVLLASSYIQEVSSTTDDNLR